MSLQRTQAALRRWAAALPAETYDVRAIPAEGGPVVLRQFTAEQLVNASSWLRHLNARGYHVYGRPFATHHVLVDDLCPDGLATITEAHTVAAVVETSDYNFQIWLTISDTPVSVSAASAVARLLAARFEGDPGAAAALQVGRLPGLANRKPLHCRSDGSYPWSRLHRAVPTIDPAGDALLAEAQAVALVAVPALAPTSSRRPLAAASPADEWRAAAGRITARLPPGTYLDRSRVDSAVARRLLHRGATEAQALAVVLSGPRAAAMNETAALRYGERTVRAAAAARPDHRGKGGRG